MNLVRRDTPPRSHPCVKEIIATQMKFHSKTRQEAQKFVCFILFLANFHENRGPRARMIQNIYFPSQNILDGLLISTVVVSEAFVR